MNPEILFILRKKVKKSEEKLPPKLLIIALFIIKKAKRSLNVQQWGDNNYDMASIITRRVILWYMDIEDDLTKA